MSGRSPIALGAFLLVIPLVLLTPGSLLAYVGPGSGLEFVPAFVSLVWWVVVAFSAVLLYPFYSFVRWVRGSKPPVNQEPIAPPPPEEPGGSNPTQT